MKKDEKVLVVEPSKKGMRGRWREMEKKDRRGHFLGILNYSICAYHSRGKVVRVRPKKERTRRAASPFSVPHFTTPKLKCHLRCSMFGSIVYKLQTSSTGIASTRALCLVPTSKARFYASLLFRICYTQERSIPPESPYSPQNPPTTHSVSLHSTSKKGIDRCTGMRITM